MKIEIAEVWADQEPKVLKVLDVPDRQEYARKAVEDWLDSNQPGLAKANEQIKHGWRATILI